MVWQLQETVCENRRKPEPRPHADNEKKTEQIQFCLGTPGVSEFDERFYALHVFNNVLGGGVSSRLFQEIREERGLAYSVYSYHSAYRDSGLFSVYAGTSPGNMDLVVELILNELSKIKQNGLKTEEIDRTKKQIKGSMYLGLENVSSRMSRLGKSELTYGGLSLRRSDRQNRQVTTVI
jgi:predicted Zn-dependent peptidase